MSQPEATTEKEHGGFDVLLELASQVREERRRAVTWETVPKTVNPVPVFRQNGHRQRQTGTDWGATERVVLYYDMRNCDGNVM